MIISIRYHHSSKQLLQHSSPTINIQKDISFRNGNIFFQSMPTTQLTNIQNIKILSNAYLKHNKCYLKNLLQYLRQDVEYLSVSDI